MFRASRHIAKSTVYFSYFPVFQLISRRRFQQIDVLEGINVLISISGTNDFSLLFCLNFNVFTAFYKFVRKLDEQLMSFFFFSHPGKQNKLRVYYLSWLKAKILKGEEVRTVCKSDVSNF